MTTINYLPICNDALVDLKVLNLIFFGIIFSGMTNISLWIAWLFNYDVLKINNLRIFDDNCTMRQLIMRINWIIDCINDKTSLTLWKSISFSLILLDCVTSHQRSLVATVSGWKISMSVQRPDEFSPRSGTHFTNIPPLFILSGFFLDNSVVEFLHTFLWKSSSTFIYFFFLNEESQFLAVYYCC